MSRRRHGLPSWLLATSCVTIRGVSVQQTSSHEPGRLFSRSASDKVLTGVAGGLGERYGIPAVALRVGFVLLNVSGPLGVLLYASAWLLSGPPGATQARPRDPLSYRQLAGLGLVVLGAMLLLRELGLWLGDALIWPLTLAAVGSALIWTRADRTVPAGRFGKLLSGPGGIARVVAGGLLVLVGLGAFLAVNDRLVAATGALMAVVVTVLGLGLIFGPWGWRLATQLADERRERIRSEERAEMAAHLHDSVLHTLALIQRSGSESEMAGLARAQERELRSWLYGGGSRGGSDPATVSSALDGLAGRVERHHGVPVETVVVGGDVPVDERMQALVDACGEATVNAARHSGADRVSVYVELEPDRATAFVRDEGKGFDLDEVPDDRHGIAHSIQGRMRRNGGVTTIHTAPGEGTEVQLELPRRDP
jgi:signal transduction histidine kinase